MTVLNRGGARLAGTDRQHKMSKTQQQYEHLLFGSVTDAELNPLLHRLRGLCDYATAGGVPFTDREIGYKIGLYLEIPSS